MFFDCCSPNNNLSFLAEGRPKRRPTPTIWQRQRSRLATDVISHLACNVLHRNRGKESLHADYSSLAIGLPFAHSTVNFRYRVTSAANAVERKSN
jgi:hypothetical protein